MIGRQRQRQKARASDLAADEASAPQSFSVLRDMHASCKSSLLRKE